MGFRCAQTIGVMAAYGLALDIKAGVELLIACDRLLATRPIAMNLKVGLDRIISSNVDPLQTARDFDNSEVAAAERIGDTLTHWLIEMRASLPTATRVGLPPMPGAQPRCFRLEVSSGLTRLGRQTYITVSTH